VVRLLASYGIRSLTTDRVRDADAALAAAERAGYPVALKASGATLLHKSDVGGVHLDLSSPEELTEAFATMRDALGHRMEGAVVQPMAEPGVETIVGVVQDPSFGPLVMFGTGGVLTELLGDRSFRIVPLTDVDATELVRSVRGAPLLFGYRGTPPTDVASLEDLLLRVSTLAENHPELAELDLNPVIASPSGAIVVDARARVTPVEPEPTIPVRRLR
jgi:acyl-CoA synthetase (NDP forming)